MSKLKITPGTNIRWEQTYGIGRAFHWCLVSDESDAIGKTINPYTVLFTESDTDLTGRPIEEHPDLKLYAEAHNVANETGFSPRELMEQRDDAIALLEKLDAQGANGDDYGKMQPTFFTIREFILSLTSPK